MPLPGFNKTVPQSDIFTTPKYRSELKTDGNEHEIRPAAHGPSDECKPGCSSARCRPKMHDDFDYQYPEPETFDMDKQENDSDENMDDVIWYYSYR
uniref:Uncharacterized protein n=1 Tax=Caenorhabditis japonica TaxID=281687 RepID=A0A8R1E7T7_CAEJA